MKIYFKTLVLFLALSTASFAQESESVTKLRKIVIEAIERAEKVVFGGEVKPDPQPKPDPKCPCNGTGFITHGDGHKTVCPVCNGKGSKAAEKVVTPNFVMYTKSWCGPCQSWKRENSKKVKDAGWIYQEIEDDATIKAAGVTSYPTFDITINGKTYRHVGKLSMSTFQEIVKNANR